MCFPGIGFLSLVLLTFVQPEHAQDPQPLSPVASVTSQSIALDATRKEGVIRFQPDVLRPMHQRCEDAVVNRKRPTAETHSQHKLNRVAFPRGPDRFLSYSFKVEFSGLAGYDFPKVRKNEDHEIKQIGEKSFKRFPPKPKN